jgi:hypothetical protein
MIPVKKQRVKSQLTKDFSRVQYHRALKWYVTYKDQLWRVCISLKQLANALWYNVVGLATGIKQHPLGFDQSVFPEVDTGLNKYGCVATL